MTTTRTGSTGSTGSNLEHAIGTDGLFSISLGSGEAHLRAVSGGTVRIRDGRGQDLADLFEYSIDRLVDGVRGAAGST